jgi:4-hydroxy-tetrahydrodipicolinate synthase
MKSFKGLMTPIITVFDKNDVVSINGLREHVNFLLENGVDMIFPCGSTGEFTKLSDKEYQLVIKTIVDEVNGKVPVFAGTAADSTKNTIINSKYAEDVGTDGVVIIPPYFSKIDENDMYAHYKSVSEIISIPIMLYNNPGRAMIDVKPEIIARLGDEGYIDYVKESSGDVRRCSKIIKLTDNVDVFIGTDTIVSEALFMGATGWVCSSSNLIPKECAQIMDAAMDEDWSKVKSIFYKVYPLLEFIESGLLLPACKQGIKMRGRDVGLPRKPILPLEKQEGEKLKELLNNLDHIEK